jgi:transposase
MSSVKDGKTTMARAKRPRHVSARSGPVRLVAAAPPADLSADSSVGPPAGREVVGGVDTHKDTHTAAVIDVAGRRLGHQTFPATGPGYVQLLDWLNGFGRLLGVGIEGTGAYGSGLATHLRDQGVEMVEVDRPDRKARRRHGKSDPVDAEAAALAALTARATGAPKDRDGAVEALRVLRVARRSAITQRADVQRQIKSLLITAPETLRARLRALGTIQLLTVCAALRPDLTRIHQPAEATKHALRTLTRRHAHLSEQITDLDTHLAALVHQINPALLELTGVGVEVAGQLLVTAGGNPDRIHTEPAFAMLCGVAPIPASSGQTRRHRLNRGGDRQANAALYTVTITRLRWDPRTQAYAQRRTAEGLSKKEIQRCLKRMIAREIYPILCNTTTPQPPLDEP